MLIIVKLLNRFLPYIWVLKKWKNVMSDKRVRITLFVLGITVGVLVGAVLVYFSFAGKKSDKSINEDNLVSKISNNVLGFLSNKENK